MSTYLYQLSQDSHQLSASYGWTFVLLAFVIIVGRSLVLHQLSPDSHQITLAGWAVALIPIINPFGAFSFFNAITEKAVITFRIYSEKSSEINAWNSLLLRL